jgi:hypothetical protein
MNCDNATKSNRKSGVAQWRDLQFYGLAWKCFFPANLAGLLPRLRRLKFRPQRCFMHRLLMQQ